MILELWSVSLTMNSLFFVLYLACIFLILLNAGREPLRWFIIGIVFGLPCYPFRLSALNYCLANRLLASLGGYSG